MFLFLGQTAGQTFTFTELVPATTIISAMALVIGGALLGVLGVTAGFKVLKKVYGWCMRKMG